MDSVWRLRGEPLVAGAIGGALRGETVAVKDLFRIAGQQVGAGVPAFLAGSEAAARTATAVQRLLDAGADVTGLAQTDQFAWSLAGDNEHYGAPPNIAVPGALPGGSSSGCATAVARGDVSIGLGTDTAGSIRVPASYQGLWGLRTTHGLVPADGVLPLAPEYDVVGLLTRDLATLRRAAGVLLASASTVPAGELVRDVDLPDVGETFRVAQAWQAWQRHGAWIEAHPGAVVGAAGARFEAARAVTDAQGAAALARSRELRAEIDAVLADRVLILPTTPGPAPRAMTDEIRSATVRLTTLASVAGRPAVTIPRQTPDGPVGLCLVGPRGSDLALLGLAAEVQAAAD